MPTGKETSLQVIWLWLISNFYKDGDFYYLYYLSVKIKPVYLGYTDLIFFFNEITFLNPGELLI